MSLKSTIRELRELAADLTSPHRYFDEYEAADNLRAIAKELEEYAST